MSRFPKSERVECREERRDKTPLCDYLLSFNSFFSSSFLISSFPPAQTHHRHLLHHLFSIIFPPSCLFPSFFQLPPPPPFPPRRFFHTSILFLIVIIPFLPSNSNLILSFLSFSSILSSIHSHSFFEPLLLPNPSPFRPPKLLLPISSSSSSSSPSSPSTLPPEPHHHTNLPFGSHLINPETK
jgi:hypothetical protein